MSDLLYHYTTEAGLTGIVGSDSIRATHVRFLNDWTEFREAFTESYVRKLLDSFRGALPTDLPVDALLVIDGMISRRAVEILEIILASESANETFVCSFTSASPLDTGDPGDRLSQWIGYASAGQGFSLGFDISLLKGAVEINNQKARAALEQCVYEDTEKNSFFEEIGREAASRFIDLRARDAKVPDSFQTAKPDASQEYRGATYYFLESLSRATAKVFTAAARIKNAGFREEREWRIMFQAAKDVLVPIVQYRDGRFGRTPYIEIPLGLTTPGTSPLRRIVVGPSAGKDDAKRMVESLLASRGIPLTTSGTGTGVEIATSLIPYR